MTAEKGRAKMRLCIAWTKRNAVHMLVPSERLAYTAHMFVNADAMEGLLDQSKLCIKQCSRLSATGCLCIEAPKESCRSFVCHLVDHGTPLLLR